MCEKALVKKCVCKFKDLPSNIGLWDCRNSSSHGYSSMHCVNWYNPIPTFQKKVFRSSPNIIKEERQIKQVISSLRNFFRSNSSVPCICAILSRSSFFIIIFKFVTSQRIYYIRETRYYRHCVVFHFIPVRRGFTPTTKER
jgi:PhoPQ-activated pathogenicity-related protein